MNTRLLPVLLCASCVLASCEVEETAEPPVAAGLPESPAFRPVGPVPGKFEDVEPRANPYADDAEALQRGREFFVVYNCYGCHGGYGGGGMGPSLRDDSWVYGSFADDIFDSISEGRANGMPAWGSMLPTELIWQITAYIESMRTDQEPSPPTQ